ncbi:TonB-dependent iron siderophore receptor/channel protein [Psychroflexus torquis ATCC 700755]|uniref:TonB-dependent iron siderophore receptor/channel protein n=1 Tax=Psychroflexus torquis (strain ATCC 700755 / CIP 106069 / ACAM 623) TaxID=313595 RepID=K4IJD6_PSYTT|nr:TonB-dependent receptor [Psychroflexus torquis]AFU70459.1 TonB-dependent iron siderophore receptor/channel protein [Psychroflexus torquis ATCC 700755]
MRTSTIKKLILSLVLLFSCIDVEAQTKSNNQKSSDSIQDLREVTIVANKLLGSKFEVKNRTGSAYFLSKKELQQQNYTDINRVLALVPGVSIYEEDGFGLRPNISLRGTSPERSSKINIMEDGVLIAPAPYSASSAYYFPNVNRMQSVEVLKGSSQIQYGPNTTGGAINFISTEIPNDFRANLRTSYGTYNTLNSYANVGDSFKNFGYTVEYNKRRSDGFKNLDNGGNTGFDTNDFVAKFRVNTNPEAKVQQSLDFKFQYSDEQSDETYLGLTDEDYEITPYRRYAGSQKDLMDAEHTQFILTHTAKFSDYFRITTTAYRNDFKRNWYKLNDVSANGSSASISNLMETPGDFPFLFGLVNGTQNFQGSALNVKNNNREYYSQGAQTKADYHFATGLVFHDIEVGLRYHQDEEDRFQWVDGYNMINGNMNIVEQGTPGTDSNRITDANALAAHVLYKLKYKRWTFTPGLRYENITLERNDFGTEDVTRTGTNLSTRSNEMNEFIPGIGVNYKFNQEFSLFGGVHKGFSPAGTTEGESSEQSVNYELGTRFSHNGFSGEVVGFYNDYSNLLGSDLAATGGGGTLDLFNAGEVDVSGLEVLGGYDFLTNNVNFSLPLTMTYTFTDAEFQNTFDSNVGIWGEVASGDEVPYISRHQFNAGLSFIAEKFEAHANARYRGEFRTLAGTGDIPTNEKVGSNFIFDISAKYHLTNNFSLTTNVINMLDTEYEVSRVPAGLRPGHPFGIYGGFEFRL